MATTKALTIEIREDGIAIVTMDVPRAPQNTLKTEFNAEFAEILETIEGSDQIRAVVFASGKPDSFIAGADIKMLEKIQTADEAAELSSNAQAAFARLAAAPVPVVAAIHGPCLGGGLELALACTARVCSDDKSTMLGLPECQLGLLPGAGGTQRLPRLIGIQSALDLMLTGRKVRGKRAKKMGICDEVVPTPVLLDAAIALAGKLADKPKRTKTALVKFGDDLALLGSSKGAQELALEKNPLGRKVLFQQARKTLLKTTKGNYPAQEHIIDIVEIGFEDGIAAGYAAEAKYFGTLVVSLQAESLIGVFNAMTGMKKDSGVADKKVKPVPVRAVSMLGAGLMGAGIAYVTVEKANIDVRLKDQDEEGIGRGLAQVDAIYQRAVRRRRMSKQDAIRQMNRITGATDYSGIERCDIVIEAVPEILELKHSVLRDVESRTSDTTIFASNTSSIPIGDIAKASAHPETVIGMHYFSPVDKMPLLEIIVTPQTADWVTATAVQLGKDQGKTVIVVNDGPGFYTSRILAPYMNEAAHLVSEGVPVDRIDKAMTQWGYPIGPMALLDEVGVDVASKVGPIMVEAFGARMEPPGTTDVLIEDGRLGRKAKKGFYIYDGKKKKRVDEKVYEVLGVEPNNEMDLDLIAERCALQMVNEAARCLEENIVRSARDGDVGAIFGLGFPPFRGGPFRFVDQTGAAEIVSRLRHFRERFGLRFEPAQILVDMAAKGKKFHK
ncbi:MAG: 3-hydroxyacyl-CoA dehydrogenase/enoyl-CoA hydratase/3-hydroxybutyryl-CoA epimerase [Bradymonadia bacterium]|jgi:3-hydroxyacyl-CoA dehydrogenase/enoyl-CoA hydratase/3-hydroxybutyryl-CoA epimerase